MMNKKKKKRFGKNKQTDGKWKWRGGGGRGRREGILVVGREKRRRCGEAAARYKRESLRLDDSGS